MTTTLEVPTPFGEFSELAENFAQRVDDQRLMLPASSPVAEGEWVQFRVLLADGGVALAGIGRCSGSYDNGEEHPPEYRFDVVLDSLELEGAAEVMFERILMARGGTGEPATGEVQLDELERQHAQAAPAAEPEPEPEADPTPAMVDEPPLAPSSDWEDANAGGWSNDPSGIAAPGAEAAAEAAAATVTDPGTGEVDIGDVEEVSRPAAAARPAAQPPAAAPAQAAAPVAKAARKERAYPTQKRAPGTLPAAHRFDDAILLRESVPASWAPAAEPRPEAAQSSGFFDYQGGLPRPAQPPRPELDPSQRVAPAPAPGRPRARPAVAVAYAASTSEMTAQVALPEGESEEW